MAQRLLHIPELLSEICNYFVVSVLLAMSSYEHPTCTDIQEARLYRATLAAVAQSHRLLFYPAVRVLWQVLDDMRPLINIYIPLEDMRRITAYETQHMKYPQAKPETRVISGTISKATPKIHARFAMYARLVRSMDIPALFTIHPTVLTHFFMLVRGRNSPDCAILPNLHSFTYAASSPMTSVVLELIYKPHVRKVTLVLNGDWSVYSSDIGDENDEEGEAHPDSWVIDDPIDLRDDVSDDCDDAVLMRALPWKLPLLEELRIKDCPSPRFLLHFERFVHLRVLDLRKVGMCDTATIGSLAASPKLVELHLPGLIRGAPVPHNGRGFEPLWTLSLNGATHCKVIHVARTLGCILPCALRDLTIWGWKLRTLGDYHEAADLLAAGCSDTLRSLRVSIRGAASQQETVNLRDLVQPFLGMRFLTKFYFNWSWRSKHLCAVDADLEVIGKAWPRLTDFHLFFDTDAEELHNLPSLRGIAALAQHAPRLDTICLPAFTWDMEPAESYPGLARRRLNGIVVYDIYLPYIYLPADELDSLTKRAAATLVRLFPRMCVWWPDGGDDAEEDFLAYSRRRGIITPWKHTDGSECDYGRFGSVFTHAVAHELEDMLEASQEPPETEDIEEANA